MKVLITGGAGFIGFHTALELARQGHAVRVLDLLDPQIHGLDASFPPEFHGSVECMRGDIREKSSVRAALKGVEAVYHFAARTGVGQSLYEMEAYADTNITGTANLLDVIARRSRKLKRFVLASSRAVYGEGAYRCPVHGRLHSATRQNRDLHEGRFDVYCPLCSVSAESCSTPETHPCRPISVYGWTKLQQEDLARLAAAAFHLPLTVLRYFNVYGAGQSLQNPYTGIVSIFYTRLQEGAPIHLYEQGLPLRDFVHVSDVVRANVLALEADVEPGAAINIGSGSPVTVRGLAESLALASGRQTDLIDTNECRLGDIRACTANLSRARKWLGYAPRMDLEGGLREFHGWARTQVADDRFEQAEDELVRFGGLLGRKPVSSASCRLSQEGAFFEVSNK